MRNAVFAVAAAAAMITTTVRAETFEVMMLNKGEAGPMVFEPAFVAAQPGDSVVFIPTDRGHNVATIEGMFPEGAVEFESELNEEYTVTFDQEGVYGLKCTPHYAIGMVALIQVGDPANLDEAAAVRHRGNASRRFDALFAEVQE